MGELALITFRRHLDRAEKIKEFMGGEIIPYSKDAFKQAFACDAVIAIMAAGIAVRGVAPLLQDKWKDPPVVVVDTGLHFAIPILGGHHGGNELARTLSGLGIVPVITTATEAGEKESVEKIAENLGYRIVNRDSTKKVNIAMMEKDVEILQVSGPKILLVDDDVSVLKKQGLVVGIGAHRGVQTSEIMDAVTDTLAAINAGIDDVKCFASAAIKENEQGIIDAAASWGKEVRFISHEVINSIQSPTPSKAKTIGLSGVCEPCALALSEEKKLVLKKRVIGNVTIAIAK